MMSSTVTRYATARSAVRFVVRGEIDAGNAPDLAAALNAALSDRTLREIVVDLTQVTFLSAAGISTLTNARAYAVEHDIALALVGARGKPRELLEGCGVVLGVFTRIPDSMRGGRKRLPNP